MRQNKRRDTPPKFTKEQEALLAIKAKEIRISCNCADEHPGGYNQAKCIHK